MGYDSSTEATKITLSDDYSTFKINSTELINGKFCSDDKYIISNFIDDSKITITDGTTSFTIDTSNNKLILNKTSSECVCK